MYNTDIPSRAELPSTKQLVRSTIVAAAVAAALLVTTILPAEYGIDPTGIGRLTGLTEMGEIKSQLSKEAEADRLRDQQGSPTSTGAEPERRSSLMGNIIAQLTIRPASAHELGRTPGGELTAHPNADTPAHVKAVRSDEMTVTLKPGQGAEVKLVMKKGAKANFAWTVEGGAVNFDTHGDGADGVSKSYEKGRAVSSNEGVLEAAFDGNHGWFWRNRTKGTVTVKLRTNGKYTEIKRVM